MDSNKKRILGSGVMIAACMMMLYGTYRGEVSLIWNKAIHICLECIGLG